jgi:hypothetical protein
MDRLKKVSELRLFLSNSDRSTLWSLGSFWPAKAIAWYPKRPVWRGTVRVCVTQNWGSRRKPLPFTRWPSFCIQHQRCGCVNSHPCSTGWLCPRGSTSESVNFRVGSFWGFPSSPGHLATTPSGQRSSMVHNNMVRLTFVSSPIM